MELVLLIVLDMIRPVLIWSRILIRSCPAIVFALLLFHLHPICELLDLMISPPLPMLLFPLWLVLRLPKTSMGRKILEDHLRIFYTFHNQSNNPEASIYGEPNYLDEHSKEPSKKGYPLFSNPESTDHIYAALWLTKNWQ